MSFAERLLRPGALRQNNNYLLLQYQSALGTVVHATPLVEALKAAQPDARIVIASGGMPAQVWEGNPHIERLVLSPNPLKDFSGAVRALRGATLFDGQPSTTLLTTGNERTKITLAALLAGPSRRVGFAVRGDLLHEHVQWDPALSQIDNNLRLLPIAIPAAAAPNTREPRIYPVRSIDFAESLVLPLRAGPRIALATQTSVTQFKKWRTERWVDLAHALRERYGAELIFVGTADEADAIDDLRTRIGFPTTSIAGRTTIQELAAVLALCDLGVVLDTGPLHVARAVGLPAVVIAPAWSPPHEWLPVGNPRYRILKNRDFPPPAPADYVIDEVSVAEVLSAAEELLPLQRMT
jgi:ADP-heptose:LPS heptosyltransferase